METLNVSSTAARNRDSILRDFVDFRLAGIALGEDGPAEYVLHSEHDPGMAERLARLALT